MNESIPKYHGKSKLPKIDEFKLSTILDQFPQETTQLTNSVVKVSQNFRKDLKNEIRLKLSIQQKLQNKNIEILKDIKRLNKELDKENISITENDMEGLSNEIDLLLEVSSDLSRDFKRISGNLKRIGEKVGVPPPEALEGYFNPHKTVPVSTDIIEVNEEAQEREEETIVEDYPKKSVPMLPQENEEEVFIEESYKEGNSKEIEDIEEMTSTDFEQFMYKTLNNYRSTQNKKYTEDIFKTIEKVKSKSVNHKIVQEIERELDEEDLQQLFNQPHFDNSLSSSFHKSQNPIDLLTTSLKTPPIVDRTLHTSHFKKLRISSPIATEEQLHYVSTEASSESSSDSDSSAPRTVVDEYYRNFRKSLSKRKRYLINTNPKHQPNHHSLKPKASILKTYAKPKICHSNVKFEPCENSDDHHHYESTSINEMTDKQDYYDGEIRKLSPESGSPFKSPASSPRLEPELLDLTIDLDDLDLDDLNINQSSDEDDGLLSENISDLTLEDSLEISLGGIDLTEIDLTDDFDNHVDSDLDDDGYYQEPSTTTYSINRMPQPVDNTPTKEDVSVQYVNGIIIEENSINKLKSVV